MYDLVVWLACFDYSVPFTLPRGEAVDCYAWLFQSFGVRGWLSKELKNVHMDNNLEIYRWSVVCLFRRLKYRPKN